HSLLLLAVGCLLAGVHIEWLFALAGGLLLLILVVAAVGEQYLPMMFGVGVAVIVAMLVARWLLYSRAQKKAALAASAVPAGSTAGASERYHTLSLTGAPR